MVPRHTLYTHPHTARRRHSPETLQYPRTQKLSKAKVRPLDVPCWLYLVHPSTPEAARKGCSQSDFSLPSSRVRETELFHLLPNDRSPRSWSVSSEEPHPLRGVGGVRWTWWAVEALGAPQYPSTQGNPSYSPPSFSFSLSLSFSLPLPLCNSLPPPHVALSSLLLQNWPKVLLLDSRVVRIHGSPPHMPHPHCPGPGRGVAFISSGRHSA